MAYEAVGQIVESISRLNEIIKPALPVLEFITGLFGLGTFAFIAILQRNFQAAHSGNSSSR